MSEHLHQPENEQLTEIDKAKHLLGYFKWLEGAVEYAQRETYDDEELAAQAADAFAELLNDRVNLLEEPGHIDLILRGEGVLVPNLVYDDTSSDKVDLLIGIDRDNPMIPLDMTEHRPARYRGAGVQATQKTDGTFYLDVMLHMKLEDVPKPGVSGRGLTIVQFIGEQYAFVKPDGSAVISADVIEMASEQQERELFLHENANSDVMRGELKTRLDELNEELAGEDNNALTELRSVKLLHKIGRLGYEQAIRGYQESEIIRKTLLYRIGLNRVLEVSQQQASDEGLHDETVSGRLVDILVPISETDQVEPSLIIEEVTIYQRRGELYQIPLQSITAFKF